MQNSIRFEKQRNDLKAKVKRKVCMAEAPSPKWVFKLINATAGSDALRSIRPRRHFDCIVTAAAVLRCTRECARLDISDQRLRISSLIVLLYCHDWPLLKRILTKFNSDFYANRTLFLKRCGQPRTLPLSKLFRPFKCTTTYFISYIQFPLLIWHLAFCIHSTMNPVWQKLRAN